ncbi:MAG: hypothetical protein A2173_02455 [Planctomycetes bacterium RBG_13_44_8b]|nr:MAG: hypothetical protein A2173_02455 [Planctomycetes bacterium RBG_13_44_8b]
MQELSAIYKWMERQNKQIFLIHEKLTLMTRKSLSAVSNMVMDANLSYQIAQRAFEETPILTRNLLKMWSEHGWSWDLNLPVSMLQDYKAIDSFVWISDFDIQIADYFEERIDVIREELVSLWPNRAKLFKQIIRAHKLRLYGVNIPTVFSQIDGMVFEKIGVEFFRTKKGLPATKNWVSEGNYENFRRALLYPFEYVTIVSLSKSQRKCYSDVINRHSIIHGENVNYATRINSLRSISMLNYVNQVLNFDAIK